MSRNIRLAFSSDTRGFARNATVIASVLRNTTRKVEVAFFLQGSPPPSFSQGRLEVTFHRTCDIDIGRYPEHVSSAVFDRLRVIQDMPAWDRCLIMDHDMLALCDLGPYFDEDFEGSLLMGRLFGFGNTLGLQMQARGGLPEEVKHAECYPYFYMGPMMNLEAMREENTWEKLLLAHKVLGQDEQMALTIATEGRVKGVGQKWNLVPHWEKLWNGPKGSGSSTHGTVGKAAEWKNGLPEGIIHWTGPVKPWLRTPFVWRPDLWEAEETSWEELRRGWWEKPKAAVVESRKGRKSLSLVLRSWKVDWFPVEGADEESFHEESGEFSQPVSDRYGDWHDRLDMVDIGDQLDKDSPPPPFPDLVVHEPLLPDDVKKDVNIEFPEDVEFVRFGLKISALPFLMGLGNLPHTIVLQGPVDVQEIQQLRKLGYVWEVKIKRANWPEGGPAPSILEFNLDRPVTKIDEDEDIYLRI